MSARTQLPPLLQDRGWMQLRSTESHQIVYFRWLPEMTREELCVNFDRAGRVSAWTVWHNQRIASPDQEPGNRTRLTEYVEATP